MAAMAPRSLGYAPRLLLRSATGTRRAGRFVLKCLGVPLVRPARENPQMPRFEISDRAFERTELNGRTAVELENGLPFHESAPSLVTCVEPTPLDFKNRRRGSARPM